MILALCLVCLVVGVGIGYAVAITRTDRLLAKMNPDEMRALGERVRRRRR